MSKKLILDIIEDQVSSCRKCSVLCTARRNTVFGEGNHNSRLFIVGEAPGVDEDKSGRPFVGRSGMLLNNMISTAGWQREQIYIANILKCRPPANRVPDPDEIRKCVGYLHRQIEAVEPDFILCLGSVASNTLIGLPIGEARGQWHTYKGYKTLCTYHPSYLLRQPEKKKEAWADLQMLIEELGNEEMVRREIAV